MAKDAAGQQSTKTKGTRPTKGKKARKTSTLQHQPTSEEQLALQQQPTQEQQPVAGPAAHVQSTAVHDEVNRLIAEHWNIGLVATQALHSLSITVALHILEMVTATALVDINAWLREQASAALHNQALSNTHPQGPAVPEEAPQRHEAHSTRSSRLTPLQISKQIVPFGRYPNARPAGMTIDPEGRLSVNNLMTIWGKPQGLSENQVKAVLNDHGDTDKGRRFTTTVKHNDLLVEVSQSTRRKAPREQHSRSYHSAIGARPPPKHRKHR